MFKREPISFELCRLLGKRNIKEHLPSVYPVALLFFTKITIIFVMLIRWTFRVSRKCLVPHLRTLSDSLLMTEKVSSLANTRYFLGVTIYGFRDTNKALTNSWWQG